MNLSDLSESMGMGIRPDLEPYINENGKAKHFSSGKSCVDQIDPAMILGLGDVLSAGMIKYGKNNWRAGAEWSEFYGSLIRHALKWYGGESIDPETGLHHLLHCICNCMFLYYYENHKLGTDDRMIYHNED